MKKHTTRNSLLLFVAACIWGMAFVSQSKGMDYMGPFTFNGVRSLIGTVSLFAYLMNRKGAKEKLKQLNWKITLQAGVMCGLALTLASTLQQIGIKYTTVGKAGFITTLYIIFVPIAGIFFRRRVSLIVWLAAGLAAWGMYLLCMTESLKLGSGDTLIFFGAIAFTIHIMLVDYYAPKTDGVVISGIQFAVCGLVCNFCALIWEQPSLVQIADGMGALLYAGVLSCGVAYTLQIIGQKGVNPTVAALLMSLESVVATVSGFVAYKIGFLTIDQSMSPRQIAGCIIVFAAVVLVQLPGEGFMKNKRNV